jgi:ubiquinone/menaquinone biosynthesis C-methylase UbiE
MVTMNHCYQAIAPDYARHRRIHPGVLDGLISTARIDPASPVLEIGCGTGNYLAALDEVTACRCWGIDPSEAMLCEARKRCTKAQFSCVPAERTALPAEHFELAFAVDVIHHISDRPQAFRECRRVLRPHGKLCLVTDSPEIIRSREPLSTYFPETVEAELARYPSLVTLGEELRTAGFSGIAEVEVEFRQELTEIEPYRAKVFSSLRLIPQNAFERGLLQLERDLSSKRIFCVSRYVMLWANNL